VSDIAEAPIDPKATTSYRVALSAVIILGILIVAALGALVFGFVTGMGRHAEAPPPPKKPVSMTIAPGFYILSTDTQPGRLIVHVRSATLDEIDIIDTDDAHVIGQIHATAPK
jgi:hypothetical protein